MELGEKMDKEKVFSLLEDLNDKQNKIREARGKLDKKRKSIAGKQDISFENINEFLSNNSETIDQLERMGKAINSLQEKYNSEFSEAKSNIFGYIFKETKRRAEEKKIYKRYQKKLKQILNAYDEIQNLKKEVEEINNSVVKELSQKYPLSLYRTEVYPHTILPFFIPDHNGDLEFKNDYRKAKEYLENN